MSDEVKQIGEVKGLFTQIQDTWEERFKAETEKGVESSELIAKNAEMAEDLMEKVKAIEKAVARRQTNTEVETNTEKSLKKLNQTLKVYKPNRAEVSRDEFLEIQKAFDKSVRFSKDSLSDAERKALNTVVDPEGGYFMMPEWGMMNAEKKFDDQGLIRLVDRINTNRGYSKDIIDWSDYDESYYQKELQENDSTQDGEDFKLFEVVAHVQKYGKKFSREFLEDDAFGVAQKVLQRMQMGMERQKAKAMIDGVNVNKPRGILTYDSGTTYGTVEQVDSINSGAISWDDVFDGVRTTLKDGYKANGAYVMNDSTFAKLLISKDDNARYQVGNQINFFSGDRFSISILGNPVVFDTNMPDVGANGLAVAYGDFAEAYKYVERSGNSIIRDETHPDYVKLWFRNRHNGAVMNFEAYKILKIKA